MLVNALKLAYRKLRKQKTYASINIIGLAIGLASFIVISLYVLDELNFDRYHKHADNIYRVNQFSNFAGNTERSSSLPFPFAEEFQKAYPEEVLEVVRLFNFQTNQILIQHDFDNFNETHAFFVDSNIFEIFDFEFILGDPKTALMDPQSVVISETAAIKYFGTANPMGDTLKVMAHQPIVVKGVFKDLPTQSHFKADVLIPFQLLDEIFRSDKAMKGRTWNPCWTYALLKDSHSEEKISSTFPDFVFQFWESKEDRLEIKLQPLTSIHLHSDLDFEIGTNSDYTYIMILGSIALFLLLMAIINFVNITTAYSTLQEREVGIKKVIGADRFELIFQFIGEALIISFLAFFIALALTELFLPVFNNLSHKEFSIADVFETRNIVSLLLIVILSGVISGLYPAIQLSKIKPVPALRSALMKSIRRSNGRKVMVVMQFSISISLIIITFIVMDQIRFIRTADLGFNQKEVVILPTSQNRLTRYFDAFKEEVLKHEGILHVTGMDYLIGIDHNNHEFRTESTKEGELEFYPALIVREGFFETFEIPILAGRDFTYEDKGKGLLVNESLVKHLGYKNNEEAIGKEFSAFRQTEEIIGVYGDFHVKSLRTAKTPFVVDSRRNGGQINWIAVKISPELFEESIDHLNEVWNRYSKERPFQFMFLEDELLEQYKDEQTLSVFSLIFSVINILIAAIGLFGLTSFITDQRTREIGIRKALGASVSRIIIQLSKDYVLLIMAANIIAWPLSYLLLDWWLLTFEYHININPLYFISAALIAISLAVGIIGYRAMKSARTSPAETLKHE